MPQSSPPGAREQLPQLTCHDSGHEFAFRTGNRPATGALVNFSFLYRRRDCMCSVCCNSCQEITSRGSIRRHRTRVSTVVTRDND